MTQSDYSQVLTQSSQYCFDLADSRKLLILAFESSPFMSIAEATRFKANIRLYEDFIIKKANLIIEILSVNATQQGNPL